MRLSKRFGLIYSFAFITIIIICLGFYIGFYKGASDGERLRISEISAGIEGNLHRYLNNIETTRVVYSNLIANKPLDINNPSKELQNVFPKNNLDYVALANSKDTSNPNFIIVQNVNSTDHDKIVALVMDSIHNSKINTYTGFVNFNNISYGVSYAPITNISNNLDYIIILSRFSDEISENLASSNKSLLRLRTDVNFTRENIFKYAVYNIKYDFKETKEKIYIYRPLNTINTDVNLFLEVSQPKKIQQIVIFNFTIYMILTICLSMTTNFLLFKILKLTVIKRIILLNRDIHNVDSDDLLLLNSSTSKINDEITDLSKEISTMFSRIASSRNELKNNELKNREILNTMTNGFIYCKSILDENNNIIDGSIIDINDSAKLFFNINHVCSPLLSSVDKSFLTEEFKSELNISLNNKQVETIHEIKFSNNCWGIISINSILDGYFFIIINDITKLKSYSEEMKQLATYDSLTSIFNRRKLIEYTEYLMKNNSPYSLFFIDLDNFKKVNDTLGHSEGDVILKGVSSDLLKLLSKDFKVGRLGGDEFVVIKEGSHTNTQLEEFGSIITKCISKEYIFKSFKFELKVSIGVASAPLDSLSNSTIMKYADIAMYNSKIHGGNTCTIFTKSMLDEYYLEDKIAEAIINNEFVTYYQPIYNVTTHTIDSVEALVRWHSIKGVIFPNNFISVAKRTGSIVDIDRKVFVDSCKLCNEWNCKHGNYIIVSINISYSLLTKEDFSDFVLSTIKKYNIPPQFIKLEITEDEIIEDISYVISLLTYLRNQGILIALDDFGVAYSSFNYIKILPLNTIKIDRSLILSIEQDEKALSIIQSLIELSKSLGLEVVCEGIEVKNQLELLEVLGCDKIQGYLFSKPLIADDLYTFVEGFKTP